MKIAATVLHVKQIGMDEFKNFSHTKAFGMDVTLQEIEDWAKLYDKGNTIYNVTFSTFS